MKALTLKRPWPFCIFHLGKRIENRSDKRGEPPMCRYRGWLLLHAGKGWDESVFERHGPEIEDFADPCLPLLAILPHGQSYRNSHRKGIVGRARVVGQVWPGRTYTWLDDFSSIFRGNGSWPEPGQEAWWQGGHAMIFDDVEELTEPIPCRGRQGLWTPPDEVLAQLPPRWIREAEVER
ncbi:MAG: hypothetical protein AAF715_19465 [Myxococcota bacterium]